MHSRTPEIVNSCLAHAVTFQSLDNDSLTPPRHRRPRSAPGPPHRAGRAGSGRTTTCEQRPTIACMERRAPGGRYSIAREISSGTARPASVPALVDPQPQTTTNTNRYLSRVTLPCPTRRIHLPRWTCIERPWLLTTQRRRACTKELDRAETFGRAHPVVGRGQVAQPQGEADVGHAGDLSEPRCSTATG